MRNHWRPTPGFPGPVGRRPTPGRGPGTAVYDRAELEEWRARWEAERDRPAPRPYPIPGDPDAYQTLGWIARALGLDGRSVTQYRDAVDARARYRQHGARRLYRVGDVIDVLNGRQGAGVARDAAQDRRRRT